MRLRSNGVRKVVQNELNFARDTQIVDRHDVRVGPLFQQRIYRQPRDQRGTPVAVSFGRRETGGGVQRVQPTVVPLVITEHERVPILIVGSGQAVRLEHGGHSEKTRHQRLGVQRTAD